MRNQDVLSNEQVLIFECDLGWNGAGGMADALKYMETYKLKWIAVGYGDGRTQRVTKEELPNLRWGVPQKQQWKLGAENKAATVWEGMSSQEVFRIFGKPYATDTFENGAGKWYYRTRITDAQGKIYNHVHFIIRNGIVRSYLKKE